MTDKAKAAIPAGTGMTAARGANNDESTGRVSSIAQDDQKRNGILRFIPFGKDSAVHLRDLVALSGLHERDIRRLIERARAAGEFILSDDRGYWRADPHTEEGAAEIMRWYRREGGRIRALAKRLEPVRQRVEASRAVGADQIQVDGWGDNAS